MDPETAQEYIDDAVREAERVAEIAIADLRATHEDEIADLRQQLAAVAAERDLLAAQVTELEPMRPLMDALHKELLRSDTIEYIPEVPGHSPAMLRIGRVVLSGMSAGALLEPLRDAALDFTDDKED